MAFIGLKLKRNLCQINDDDINDDINDDYIK